ncbi:MAG TPA: tRNA (adenosine(37)-N6)-threonylcarbamoyltransferase complex transferase subunit TsaD [Patescibacteria group bacterium]|nr:tRNA (adenosine(37)-N6)-threonylcarbamoyltransferase complex transferase subunit TsaD [Patescibacteria group bacterium]
MYILSIETSCDDTAAAIVQYDDGCITVLANTVSSQATLHNEWGGVVPNLASREHTKNIVPVIEETLKNAKLTPQAIDLIAVTEGPGLMPALIVGVSAAKTLALIWQKPLIGIHHIEGHIYANFLNLQNNKCQISNDKLSLKNSVFPLMALVVSGGHTQLILMRDHFQYEILGETEDDAAGEAFDKVAKMLGLPYPGGPEIALRASNFQFSISHFQTNPNNQISNLEIQSKFSFPRPMIKTDNFNFSFSGLKTAVLYFLKKHPEKMQNAQFIDEVCYEFQEAVVDVLVAKTKKALALYAPKTLVIAGGVSANVRLREQLKKIIDILNLEALLPKDKIHFMTPEFTYSLDNAMMIGVAAGFRYARMSDQARAALKVNVLTLDPDANLPLQNL